MNPENIVTSDDSTFLFFDTGNNEDMYQVPYTELKLTVFCPDADASGSQSLRLIFDNDSVTLFGYKLEVLRELVEKGTLWIVREDKSSVNEIKETTAVTRITIDKTT